MAALVLHFDFGCRDTRTHPVAVNAYVWPMSIRERGVGIVDASIWPENSGGELFLHIISAWEELFPGTRKTQFAQIARKRMSDAEFLEHVQLLRDKHTRWRDKDQMRLLGDTVARGPEPATAGAERLHVLVKSGPFYVDIESVMTAATFKLTMMQMDMPIWRQGTWYRPLKGTQTQPLSVQWVTDLYDAKNIS